MIRFNCACGREFNVADDKAGMKGRCPVCGEVVVIPQSNKTTVHVFEAQESTCLDALAQQVKSLRRSNRVLFSIALAGPLFAVLAATGLNRLGREEIAASHRESVSKKPELGNVSDLSAKEITRETTDEEMRKAMEKTDYSTWLAMLDTAKILGNDSQESARVRGILDKVDSLYRQDRETIVLQTMELCKLRRETGLKTFAIDILRGSLEWPSSEYVDQNRPMDYIFYIDMYREFGQKTLDHKLVVKAVAGFANNFWDTQNDPKVRELANGRRPISTLPADQIKILGEMVEPPK